MKAAANEWLFKSVLSINDPWFYDSKTTRFTQLIDGMGKCLLLN
jgi:hypothetical protein